MTNKFLGPYDNADDALESTRINVAKVVGLEDPESWPEHGNAPLAITATVAYLRNTLISMIELDEEVLEQTLDTIEFDNKSDVLKSALGKIIQNYLSLKADKIST